MMTFTFWTLLLFWAVALTLLSFVFFCIVSSKRSTHIVGIIKAAIGTGVWLGFLMAFCSICLLPKYIEVKPDQSHTKYYALSDRFSSQIGATYLLNNYGADLVMLGVEYGKDASDYAKHIELPEDELTRVEHSISGYFYIPDKILSRNKKETHWYVVEPDKYPSYY